MENYNSTVQIAGFTESAAWPLPSSTLKPRTNIKIVVSLIRYVGRSSITAANFFPFRLIFWFFGPSNEHTRWIVGLCEFMRSFRSLATCNFFSLSLVAMLYGIVTSNIVLENWMEESMSLMCWNEIFHCVGGEKKSTRKRILNYWTCMKYENLSDCDGIHR